MTRIKFLTSVFLSLSLYTYSTIAFSAPQSHIGIVISTIGEGKVTATNKQNNRRILKRSSKIYLHDKIITQKDSKAQLMLNDKSHIILGFSSEFYVSEFSFNKKSRRNNKYVGNIIKGALRNISGQGKTENYKLNSPLVTIAFRGTGLDTNIISKKNVAFNQEVFVFKGHVTVKNRCENVIGACSPASINIGAGQKANAATIDRTGKITGFKSSGLTSRNPGDLLTDMTLIKRKGGVTVKCKGKR